MRLACASLLGFVLSACSPLQQAIEGAPLTETAPEPATPLPVPTETMVGHKGSADAPYPPDYAVTLKPDGTIVFPQHTMGHVRGGSILVEGESVLAVSPGGVVKGSALKHVYHFDERGQLVDDAGRGVRISPEGDVHALGGPWRYQDVLAWKLESGAGWDHHAWRTLEVIALVVIENVLPQALRGSDAGADDRGKGFTIPPPSQWFK